MSPFARLGAAVALSLATPFAAAACFVAAGSMSFGAYDVFDAQPRDSMLVLTLSCHEAKPRDLRVSIGPSANSGGIAVRQMNGSAGADRLAYNLFSDASRSQVWGDGTAAAPVDVLGVNRNAPQQLIVYGRIPASQDVSIGDYADAVTVTVEIIR